MTYKFKLGVPYKQDDVLDFGKYKGKTVAWVLENNAGYIHWCMENINGFAVSFSQAMSSAHPDVGTAEYIEEEPPERLEIIWE